MLIVFRCYYFCMVGSQGGESLLIMKSYFKTSLESLLQRKECSRYTWPGKASRCEADADARGSRPHPPLSVRACDWFTPVREQKHSNTGARWDCPGWAVDVTPRGAPRRGSFRIWGSLETQDGELCCSSCSVFLLMLLQFSRVNITNRSKLLRYESECQTEVR